MSEATAALSPSGKSSHTFCDPQEGCLPLAGVRVEMADVANTAKTAQSSATTSHRRIDALMLLMIGNLVATIGGILAILFKH
jgi:hypothetical protein